jgi:hypothetical protein
VRIHIRNCSHTTGNPSGNLLCPRYTASAQPLHLPHAKCACSMSNARHARIHHVPSAHSPHPTSIAHLQCAKDVDSEPWSGCWAIHADRPLVSNLQKAMVTAPQPARHLIVSPPEQSQELRHAQSNALHCNSGVEACTKQRITLQFIDAPAKTSSVQEGELDIRRSHCSRAAERSHGRGISNTL